MKKFKSTLLVIFIAVLSAAILLSIYWAMGYWTDMKNPSHSIRDYEFSIKKMGKNNNLRCVEPRSLLVERCEKAGGELQFVTTGINLGIETTFGCYPTATTTDVGKPCGSNGECEGECGWFNGDFTTEENPSSTCTIYKKPFFIYEYLNNEKINFWDAVKKRIRWGFSSFTTRFCESTAEKNCDKKSGLDERDGCYKASAVDFFDEELCDKISSVGKRDECLESLAFFYTDKNGSKEESLKVKFELCAKVSSPVAYCKGINDYYAVLTTNDVGRCYDLMFSVDSMDLIEQCYQHMAQKTNRGAEICDDLKSISIAENDCRNSIEKGCARCGYLDY